ncbi:hypothetical protein [Brevundimonas diminuta]|uniref:hypothetical protein n=1 Tax=Brevundimonas diminuta TaxID=293 RepID=UPI00320A7D08
MRADNNDFLQPGDAFCVGGIRSDGAPGRRASQRHGPGIVRDHFQTCRPGETIEDIGVIKPASDRGRALPLDGIERKQHLLSRLPCKRLQARGRVPRGYVVSARLRGCGRSGRQDGDCAKQQIPEIHAR